MRCGVQVSTYGTGSSRCGCTVVLLGNSLELVRVLGGARDVDLVLVNLNLEAGREERVEPDNQVWVALEQAGDSTDHPRGVDAVRRRETGCNRPSAGIPTTDLRPQYIVLE